MNREGNERNFVRQFIVCGNKSVGPRPLGVGAHAPGAYTYNHRHILLHTVINNPEYDHVLHTFGQFTLFVKEV